MLNLFGWEQEWKAEAMEEFVSVGISIDRKSMKLSMRCQATANFQNVIKRSVMLIFDQKCGGSFLCTQSVTLKVCLLGTLSNYCALP